MGEQPFGAIVVGTGFGVLTHLRALRAAGIEVVALVGRDADKAAERAKRFEVPHATNVLAEALALPGVDAVTVATPPHSHAAIVGEAVAAGKHVVCEKPFARDLAEARSMLVAAEQAGVVHLMGNEFRFSTGQALLRRVVRSGAIGEPRVALFQLQLPLLADPAAGLPGWWDDASQGGGWLGAYGSHVIDQLRSTTGGEVTGLSASLRTLTPRPAMTADDTYVVHLELDNGCVAMVHSSCAIGGQLVATSKLTGSSGSAWLQGDEVWLDTGGGAEQVPAPDDLVVAPPDPPPAELLHTTYDLWHSSGIDVAPYARLFTILGDRAQGRAVADDAATFADGAACQSVMDAIHRSANERVWVTPEPV